MVITKVKMVEEDKDKMTLILEWGTYAYNVMPFGLCISILSIT